MNVAFFGHRDTTQDIEQKLEAVLISLIEDHDANTFYVGNQGNFDFIARKILKKLKTIYPQITYTVVLAYMPGVRSEFDLSDYSDTMYPEGLENTPRKFAILKRNLWLIEHSDIVITYVRHYFGGAGKFKEIAEKKGKRIINIAD